MSYETNQTPATFPQELPPRTQQASSRGGFRNCLTCRFLNSYSLRGVTDTRKKWRRIAMIGILVILIGSAIADVCILLVTGLLGWGIPSAIIDFLFVWAMGWSLAVIGDAVGTKKICGMAFGRTFFDCYLYAAFVLYVLWFILLFFEIGWTGFQIVWLVMGVLTFVVAWFASEPPVNSPAVP